MKQIRVWMLFVVAIVTALISVGGVWAVNDYITSETKEDVKNLSECVSKQHEKIRDVEEEVEVYKAKQEGELNLLRKEVKDSNKKLDSIIKAINDKNGFLICDPIETPKKRDPIIE